MASTWDSAVQLLEVGAGGELVGSRKPLVYSALVAAVERHGLFRVVGTGIVLVLLPFAIWWYLRPPAYAAISAKYRAMPTPMYMPEGL